MQIFLIFVILCVALFWELYQADHFFLLPPFWIYFQFFPLFQKNGANFLVKMSLKGWKMWKSVFDAGKMATPSLRFESKMKIGYNWKDSSIFWTSHCRLAEWRRRRNEIKIKFSKWITQGWKTPQRWAWWWSSGRRPRLQLRRFEFVSC